MPTRSATRQNLAALQATPAVSSPSSDVPAVANLLHRYTIDVAMLGATSDATDVLGTDAATIDAWLTKDYTRRRTFDVTLSDGRKAGMRVGRKGHTAYLTIDGEEYAYTCAAKLAERLARTRTLEAETFDV